jgi:hypothetical protein
MLTGGCFGSLPQALGTAFLQDDEEGKMVLKALRNGFTRAELEKKDCLTVALYTARWIASGLP